METIEVIEEKKMIKRLLAKFFGNILVYGLLYIGIMAIFLMFAIFQEETLISVIMMCLINVAINLGFMTLLSNSSISTAFEGINTVNVPPKSRKRILKIAGIILIILMILITWIDIVMFHALFKSKTRIDAYALDASTIEQARAEATQKYGVFTSVGTMSNNRYVATKRAYSNDAIIIIGVIVIINLLIVIGAINYENNLLKKYLTT